MPIRTERQIVTNDTQIDDLCFRSKNLYNYANYLIRQEFIVNKKWIQYNKLDTILKTHEAYMALPAQSAQQTLRLLDKNWKSFFKAIKAWKKDPSNFCGMPRLPNYKNKTTGRNIVVFTNQQVKVKDGYIRFPKKANVAPIKTSIDKFKQVRIIPQATCYVIEIIYNKKEIPENEKPKLDTNNIMAIDLGVNNLATCVNNIGKKPFIVNGRICKSINQFFNKEKARLQKIIKIGTSKKIKKLILKRNNKISDQLHKASRYIIDICLANAIGTIVIGYNPEWKQEANMGKRNNQNFVLIPFLKFIKMLTYKGAEYGIVVLRREEGYTSKCSFLDNEEIGYHDEYAGRRVKRGLFRSAKGFRLNADVNAAYNHMIKELPNALEIQRHGIEGLRLNPNKVSVGVNCRLAKSS